jgi:signal transduction histidine kinase/ActR/RegA family two-component response regulator
MGFEINAVQALCASLGFSSLARLSTEELDKVSQTVPILIKRYDTERRCIYISPGSERFTAKPVSWFIGRCVADYEGHPAGFLEALNNSITKILTTGEPQNFETTLEKPWGTVRQVHYHCPEYDDLGNIVSILSIVFDVTSKHNALTELQRAVEVQSHFLAMMAHELRNPLAAILSGLEALDRGPADVIACQVRSTMHREATHIARLVEDILDSTRLETGALTYQMQGIPIDDPLNLAIATTESAYQRAGQTLTCRFHHRGAMVLADGNRVSQAISNLLHNASKFSARGAEITISSEKSGGRLFIDVEDQGGGVPKEQHEKIFERYIRGTDDRPTARAGLGLGLYVAREIIRSHQGDLSLYSSSPSGSTFRITLPVACELKDAPVSVVDRQAPLRQLRILIIDDNVPGVEALQCLLELEGHVVFVATSAAEGEAAVKRLSPDVVLLDINLPDESGLVLVRRLRACSPPCTCAVFALTGWGTDDDRQRSLDAGCDDHLTKPITIEKLVAAMATTVSRYSNDNLDSCACLSPGAILPE